MTYRPDELPWPDLARYFGNEMTEGERAEFEFWVKADSERQRLVESLREVWETTGEPGQQWDAESALRQIKSGGPSGARVIARLRPKWSFDPLVGRSGRIQTATRAAAAIALLLGGTALWQLSRPTDASPPKPGLEFSEIRTASGQRLALRLSDSTQVMLGPSSALRIPSGYGAMARLVQLEGQAYFVVTHDEMRPFSVHTAVAVARDLGTRFVVRAYQGDPTAEVVVAEGTVAVGRRQSAEGDSGSSISLSGILPLKPLSPDSLVLEAGDRGQLAGEGRPTLTRGVALDRYLGWTEGRLVFRDTPLRDVLPEIARWHDVEVRLGEPALAGRRVTATFTNEPVSEILRLVSASVGLRSDRQGSAFVLRGR